MRTLKYRIRKSRSSKAWGLWEVRWQTWGIEVAHLKDCATWEEAMFDAQFLINADRAMKKFI